MTQNPSSQPNPTPDQLPWGIAYLREDIQDLRQEMRDNTQEVRQEIQGLRQEVRQEIRSVHGRIDELNRSLGDRLDSRFAWTIGTVIAVAGVIVAAIKF